MPGYCMVVLLIRPGCSAVVLGASAVHTVREKHIYTHTRTWSNLLRPVCSTLPLYVNTHYCHLIMCHLRRPTYASRCVVDVLVPGVEPLAIMATSESVALCAAMPVMVPLLVATGVIHPRAGGPFSDPVPCGAQVPHPNPPS